MNRSTEKIGHGRGVVRFGAMNLADIRAFLQRDRAAVEEEKRAHRVEEYRRRGPEATLLAAARMYEYARAVRPDFPTEADLAEDLTHHVAWAQRPRSLGWRTLLREQVAHVHDGCAERFDVLSVGGRDGPLHAERLRCEDHVSVEPLRWCCG